MKEISWKLLVEKSSLTENKHVLPLKRLISMYCKKRPKIDNISISYYPISKIFSPKCAKNQRRQLPKLCGRKCMEGVKLKDSRQFRQPRRRNVNMGIQDSYVSQRKSWDRAATTHFDRTLTSSSASTQNPASYLTSQVRWVPQETPMKARMLTPRRSRRWATWMPWTKWPQPSMVVDRFDFHNRSKFHT